MYKLLLVDDEADVREGVLREIDWAACGFEVVGTAENGKEAAELAEKLLPDIVVTDIRMPFMDGLQLSEWLRANCPSAKIIILTGYDEFEYAKQAVKLNINEYVLKPFSSRELMEALAKVKVQMDEEAAQKENLAALKEHYRRSLPVLREVFLASLIAGRLGRRDIEDKAANYDLDLRGDGFMVSVVSIDPSSGSDEETEDGAGPESLSLKDSPDGELKRFAVFNIAEEIVNKHGFGYVFLHHDEVVWLAVGGGQHHNGMKEKALSVLEETRHNVEKYLKFTVTAGVGTAVGAVTEVSRSYREAAHALDYRLVLGGNRIICIDDVEKRFVEPVRFDDLKEYALIRCLKVGTMSEMKTLIDDLFDSLAEQPVSVKDCQIYFLEILTAILRAAKDAGVDPDDIPESGSSLVAEMFRLSDLHEAKQWFVGLCSRIMNHIASDRTSAYRNLAEEAKEYVKRHYHESDLSIQKVCAHLHLSSGYFSNIFKRETRMTFVHYLLHVRTEAAKELLRSTDLKTFEIAEKVGYADPNYFSFSFKKHVGMSPKEYRNLSREA